MRQRADRIVHTLTSPHDAPSAPQRHALGQLLQKVAQLHRLQLQLDDPHQLPVYLPLPNLDCALDNIFKNYREWAEKHQLPKPCLQARISPDGGRVQLRLHLPGQRLDIPPERLFEPFWSNDAQGLGIGMYQARQMLENADAHLLLEKTDLGEPCFLLDMPSA